MSSGFEPLRQVVIGLGNPDRGDDGVGRLVVRLLEGRLGDDVLILEQSGGAAALLETLREADWVVLVDAMVSGAPIGSIRRVDCAAGDPLPVKPGASSHGLGVAEAIGLARALGCLPRACVVFGVEASRFDPGTGLSPAVAAAAHAVAGRIGCEVVEAKKTPPPLEGGGWGEGAVG